MVGRRSVGKCQSMFTPGRARCILRQLCSSSKVDNVQVTTLNSKIRVATSNTSSHFTTVGAYVDAGPKYETTTQLGASHFLERLAFKSSRNLSTEQMTKLADSLGGQVLCASSREAMIYQASHLGQNASEALSLIAETILNPLISPEDVDTIRETTLYELREMENKPEVILPEVLHHVAFGSSGLGNPIMCPVEQVNRIDGPLLHTFRQTWYRPERLVIAGAGVDHNTLVRLAEERFQATSFGPATDIVTSVQSSPSAVRYQGGHRFFPMSKTSMGSGLGHIFIGFKGLPIYDPGIYTLAIIQFLLGGGGSFSAGGPGKGMYTRFYTNVLNHHPEVEHCSAFHHIYTDTSLFGVCASFHDDSDIQRSSSLRVLSYLLEQLRLLLTTTVPEVELNRAKNQLKSSLIMGLESQATEVEDLGRQILVHGYRIPALEMSHHINQVTSEDIQSMAHRIFGYDCKDPVSFIFQGQGEIPYQSSFKIHNIGGGL